MGTPQRINPRLAASNYKIKMIKVKPVPEIDLNDEFAEFFGYKYASVGNQPIRIPEYDFSEDDL
jgi:hypothetical protein